MPPEQAQGLAIDGRTDVYTLGLIMHEMLMGRPTFRGDSVPALIMMQLRTEPPPLALPGMPEGLEPLIMQMLRKKPDERPASMEEVLGRLDAIGGSHPDPHRRRTEPVASFVIDPAAAATMRMEAPPETRLAPVTAFEPVATFPSLPGVSASSMAPAAAPAPAVAGSARAVRGPAPTRAPTPARAPTHVDTGLQEAFDDGPPPTLQRSRTPLIAGAVALVGVVVAVAAVLLSRSPPAAGPAPSKPPAATKGPPAAKEPVVAKEPAAPPAEVRPPPPPPEPRVRLVIDSVPPKADVWEGEVLLGTTPLTLQRKVDSVAELRFELRGHARLTRKVGFSADTTMTVSLEPVRRAPAPRPPVEELKDAPF
jgi:hypothetical protein